MNSKELFEKYYSRLAKEGFFKALFASFAIGFAASFLTAFLCWYYEANGVLWSIVTLVVVGGGLTPLFYFKKFIPSMKEIAKRLDALGLEERMITMTEFQMDDSYIAMRQREDARITLNSVDKKRIRFKFPTVMIVLLAVAFVASSGMTTVSGLTSAGIISSGKEVFAEIIPEPEVTYYNVTYLVGEGEGLIEGDDLQIVEAGGNTTEVIAIADDGFIFVEWSDGIKEYARMDYDIEEDLTIEAIFAPIAEGEGEGDGGEGAGEGAASGGDAPAKSDQPSDELGEPNNGANGAYEQNNTVKDGTVPYREILEAGGYYEAAIEWLQTAENVPDSLREFIQTYFDIIV